MTLRTWIAVGLFTVSGLCQADEFYLKHEESGRTYGPFVWRQGARVRIGEVDFTLIIAATERPTVEQKLKMTVIPEIDFRQATVADTLEFLKQAGEEFSPFENLEHKGVNLILNPRGDPDVLRQVITFRARQLTLEEALRAVTRIANLRYTVQGNLVIVEPEPVE